MLVLYEAKMTRSPLARTRRNQAGIAAHFALAGISSARNPPKNTPKAYEKVAAMDDVTRGPKRTSVRSVSFVGKVVFMMLDGE